VPLGWIEFVVFTIGFNANVAYRVNEEFLWGRHQQNKAQQTHAGLFLFEPVQDTPLFKRGGRSELVLSEAEAPPLRTIQQFQVVSQDNGKQFFISQQRQINSLQNL